MAVFTQIDDDTLTHLMAGYDLGTVVSLHGIVEGVENSNFLLHTTSGRYILTLFERRTSGEDLPFFIHLMQHLARAGIPSPMPLPDKQGRVLQQVQGKPALIVSFLTGLSVRRPSPAHGGLLGEMLARFHLAAANFPETRLNSVGVQAWGKMVANLPQQAPEKTWLQEEATFLKGAWPKDLPKGCIHGDAFPDNVFFREGEVSGLIDFYFACTDFFAYELAICLSCWCFERDGSFNTTTARQLLKRYDAVRPLEEREWDALPILLRGACLRFSLTRLEDWHAPKEEDSVVVRKNPADYLHRLRFAAGVGSVRDWGLSTTPQGAS